MLLKELGNLNIDKLCVILLIEADYNWLAKLLVNRRLIPHAEELGLIPDEEFSSRTDHRAIKVAVCQCFFWDRLRQLRRPGGLGSFDAAQCYDKIVHLFCLLGAQSWGMPLPAIVMLLLTIQLMTFFLRTGYGVSDCSYDGTWSNPFQGVCQGNGGSPSFWLMCCSFLVQYLHQVGHIIRFISAISGAILSLAA